MSLGEYYVSGTNEVNITMSGVPVTEGTLSLKYKQGKVFLNSIHKDDKNVCPCFYKWYDPLSDQTIALRKDIIFV